MDINQGNNRQCGVLNDDMNNSEKLTQTSATCGVRQGMDIYSSSKDKEQVNSKVLTTSESSCKSKTVDLSTDQLEQSKSLAESLCEEECDKENNPKLLEHEAVETKDENGRYENNLRKFLENNVSKEIRLRGKISGREIKSDGEIAKMTNYCGNMSKISLVLSKVNLKRSSAPPTYEDRSKKQLEISKREIPEETFRQVPELNESGVANSKTPVSIKNENSLPINVPENSTSKVKNFKLPVTPTCATTTPGNSSQPRRDSQGVMKTPRETETTPVVRRPTDFTFKPRKAIYTFSPDSCGILKKCRSLPNINKQQRKKEKQRRSLIFDERSAIVRALFRDNPETSTPETKQSAVPNRNVLKCAKETTSASSQQQGPSQEKSLAKGTSDVDRKSKICRRLTFASSVSDETDNVKSTKAEVEKEKPESPQKRKEISPQFAEVSPTSAKKVRISPELEKKEENAGPDEVINLHSTVCEEKSVSFSSSGEKKSSPVKRKAQEPEDSTSSKKK